MNRPAFAASLAAATLLIGCASVAPPRTTALPEAVAVAGAGHPSLPALTDPYPDAAALPTPLTREQAVQFALRNQPRVRAALARLDAAQAERVQAGLIRNPVSSLMAMRPGDGGRYQLTASLTEGLFDLFTRSRQIAVADAAQRRTDAEVAMAVVALAQDTEAAYYAWRSAADRLQVQQALQALADTRQRLVDGEVQQGLRPAGDSLSARAAASERAHMVQLAQSAVVQARTELARRLGLPSTEGLILPDAPPVDVLAPLDDATLQALAVQHRPERLAAGAALDQAQAERAVQTSALRTTEPMLGVNARRETSGMRMVGPNLQIALPVFDSGQARRALADARVAEAQANAEAVQREVPLEVERALDTLLAAQLALRHAEHHVAQQTQLEQLAERTYRQGTTDWSAREQAEQARWRATLDRIDAQDALWAAMVALERATGVAAMQAAATSVP